MSDLNQIVADREAAVSAIGRSLGDGISPDTRRNIASFLYSLPASERATLARTLSRTRRSDEEGSGPSLVDLLDGDFLEAFRARQMAPIEAVPTPLPGWNRCCRDDGGGIGLARRWFIAIGGNTKSGKSLLALNLAESALAVGQTVGFVSLEMSVEQLTARFLSISSGVPIRKLEKGPDFDPAALDQAWSFARERYDMGAERDLKQTVLVNQEVLSKPEAVWDCMKEMHRQGCTFFVLDYLQLVSAGSEDDLYKQVFSIANACRLFKDEYNVTILGLSQYNRQTSADYTKSPVPQSLHGGSIENGVDQVLLLDHSRYARDEMRPHLARTFLNLAANRHGEAGDLAILWDYTTLRVREGQPDEERDWPVHGSKR